VVVPVVYSRRTLTFAHRRGYFEQLLSILVVEAQMVEGRGPDGQADGRVAGKEAS
jgi:hypothetical protein